MTKMTKRLAAVLAATVVAASALTAPAFAETEVDEGYDYTRFADDNITLNVYNWGEYISDGSEGTMDVVAEFEELTGIHVNYTTFDTNESLYAKLKSGGAPPKAGRWSSSTTMRRSWAGSRRRTF